MTKNNNLILFVVLGLIFIFGLYCLLDNKNPGDSTQGGEKYSKKSSNKKRKDVEFLGGAPPHQEIDFLEGSRQEIESDAFELLGVASNDPALELQFGMGPGLLGSGRHTSSMVGN